MIGPATAHDVAPAPALPFSGVGRVRVSADRGPSVVRRAFAASPLRLLLPRNHGRAAWIYTSTFGGGLLGGDALDLQVTVDSGAMAFLSTQASTKIYRPAHGAAASSSHLTATLHPDSLLVVAPDPVVCFAASRYAQRQRFSLEGSASLIVVDAYTSGRQAMGERWAFGGYSSRTDVHRDGRLVWYDALRLNADDGAVAARLGRFEAIASIGMFGTALREHAAWIVGDVANRPLARQAAAVVTASTVDDGCVIRLAGVSVETVSRTIRQLLAFVPRLLGDDPWARRW